LSNVLFVSNGHGEAAIAKRIATELRARGTFITEHLALVGSGFGDAAFADVGPQAAMPSGGLVAMGNVRAFARDLQAGFLVHLTRQLRFLHGARARYAVVVAVGDVYALLLARLARRPVIFVGTAKSVYVAPYGPVERQILRTARVVFVRDEATAKALNAQGVDARAPGNVIVDLLTTDSRYDWGGAEHRIAILPGSRERAYADAAALAAVARAVVARVPESAAAMSIAPGLDPVRFAATLADDPPIRGWQGDLGALIADASIVLGQAGTANEAAAAHGVPVVALDRGEERTSAWYRMRQSRLLGDALALVPGDPGAAADAIATLLNDGPRRARMGAVGRMRMGGPGGARAVAQAIAEVACA
jgi:hypothetical protein